MRYAAADSSDSDASEAGPSRHRPRTTLGKHLRGIIDSSDDDDDEGAEAEDFDATYGRGRMGTGRGWDPDAVQDSDSDDDVEMSLGGGPGPGSSRRQRPFPYSRRPPTLSKTQAPPSGNTPSLRPLRESHIDALLRVVDEAPTGYDAWLKITAKAEWRDGHKLAHSRRLELREIALNAREALRGAKEAEATREAEDMRKMLEGMSLRVRRDEEEAARVFKEREKKLWEDIDAAIKRAEELATQQRDLAIAAKQKEADAAKEAAEDKARVEGEARRAAELAAAQRAREEDVRKEEEEAQRRAAAVRGQTGADWRRWTETQGWMKRNVIERVKADRETRAGLRGGMRLITRGLGQVVNTKESIVRVTNEIAGILCAQLPSAPSPFAPLLLDTTSDLPDTPGPTSPPRAYLYLVSHISKALIKQAESEVSANQSAAFPLARIILGLFLRGHTPLASILFARLVKKCPWVVPFYPSRAPDQPREAYEQSTGRGSDEPIAEYTSRMAGIASLYFAVLQAPLQSFLPTLAIGGTAPAPPPTPEQLAVLVPEAWRLPAAWTWLAHALRAPLVKLDPVAHLVATWVEVCGHEVGRVFGVRALGGVYARVQVEGVERAGVGSDSRSTRERLGLVLRAAREGQGGEPEGRVWG